MQRVPLANTAQDPHVLLVPLEDIKQQPLEQLPAPPVLRVSQDLPIRPLRVLLLQIERALPALHVPLADGEVRHVQQPQIQVVYPA